MSIQQQLADLVKINAFWRDYAAYLADGAEGPFLSEHVAEPTSTELLLHRHQQVVGLVLFVYSIGLQVGPGFFSSLNMGRSGSGGAVSWAGAPSLRACRPTNPMSRATWSRNAMSLL